ncbi:hypothetical protein O3M34_21170, partial [Yersinia pestis]|nr:hypothetical protein [Yersinia pestis]
CPRNPGKGSPLDPDTCLLRSPASRPNQNLFLLVYNQERLSALLWFGQLGRTHQVWDCLIEKLNR